MPDLETTENRVQNKDTLSPATHCSLGPQESVVNPLPPAPTPRPFSRDSFPGASRHLHASPWALPPLAVHTERVPSPREQWKWCAHFTDEETKHRSPAASTEMTGERTTSNPGLSPDLQLGPEIRGRDSGFRGRGESLSSPEFQRVLTCRLAGPLSFLTCFSFQIPEALCGLPSTLVFWRRCPTRPWPGPVAHLVIMARAGCTGWLHLTLGSPCPAKCPIRRLVTPPGAWTLVSNPHKVRSRVRGI